MKKSAKDKYIVSIIRFVPYQKRWLAHESKKTNLSEATIVRSLIDTAIQVDKKEL